MQDDENAMYTPQYNNLKKGEGEFDLVNKIQQSANPSLLASTIGYVLLRQLSLEGMLATERAGGGPNVEGLLKQVLTMQGISVDNDVLYGISIPQDIRQMWQRAGIDPDSENEVIEYLEKNNVNTLGQYDMPPNSQYLRDYATRHGLVPNESPSPTPAKPKPGQ